jgi:hypothetical protein
MSFCTSLHMTSHVSTLLQTCCEHQNRGRMQYIDDHIMTIMTILGAAIRRKRRGR